MPEAKQIILKIFSGPHMGAEIPLMPGDIVVGSGESCDVILHDSTVAPQHVHITVPADSGTSPVLFLRTLDSQIALMEMEEEDAQAPDEEGEQTPEQEDGLRPFLGEMPWPAARPVMLGTTCLAWQVEGESWGDIGPAAFLDEGRGKTAQTGEGRAAEEEPEEDIDGPDMAFKPRSERARRIFKIVAAVAVVLFLTVTFSGGPDTHLAEEMEDMLADAGYDYLSVQQTAIGVTIQGTVPLQGDRKSLWQLAGNMEFPVFIDVHVREERAQAVRVALAVRGLFPHVELDGKNIVLTGYFRDKLIEGAAKIWIAEDIRHIEEIRSSMVYAAQVWPIFREALVRHELHDLVVVRLHPGVVEVEGELDFEQREQLELAKKETCDALNSPIAFWDTLTAPGFSAEWNASINSSNRSAFAPDPALAQLFRDTQELKGAAQFAPTPALKATPGTSAITTLTPTSPLRQGARGETPGGGIDLRNAPSMDNALGGVVSLVPTEPDASGVTAARDRNRNVVRDGAGQPLVDRHGHVVRDDDGKPISVHPAVIGGEEFKVVRDAEGNVIRDEQDRALLARKGEILRDEQGVAIPGHEAMIGDSPITIARDAEGNIIRDEQGRPLLMRDGEILRDKDGVPVPGHEAMIGKGPFKVARDAEGNVLRDEQGRPILTTDGVILRDKDGKPVAGHEVMVGEAPVTVARDADGYIVRDDDGNILVERDGKLLLDDQGRPVAGSKAMIGDAPVTVARDADGNVMRDEQGRPLLMRNGQILRDEDGIPVTGRDEMFRDGPSAVIVDKDGNPVLDKDGKPLVVQALRDETGDILRDRDGNPVFPVVARDKDGNIIRDAEGNPVLLGPVADEQGRYLRDADGNLVPAVVARDERGDIVYDAHGNPLVVAPPMDEQGRVMRDADGNVVAPRVMTGADGKPARSADGSLILVPEDANEVGGAADEAGAKVGENDEESPDYKQFGAGMGFADAFDKDEEPVDVLGGLTITGVTIEPIPFISMKDGQKFFTGGRLPSGFIIREISTEKLVVERDGNVVTKIFERR